MDSMKLSSLRKDIGVLVLRLLLAEIILGLSVFLANYFFDVEAEFSGSGLNKLMEYDLFSALALILFEAAVIVLIFWRWQRQFLALDRSERVKEIIDAGEGETTEFKQSLRWDMREQKYNKELEKAVVKNIAGFMNADGGVVIVGVSDGKELSGLQPDYKTLPKANRDGWENHLNQLIKTYIGLYWRRYLKVSFANLEGKEVCSIEVRAADKPAYFKDNEAESFYVRTGNSTNGLSISEATEYIGARWKGKE